MTSPDPTIRALRVLRKLGIARSRDLEGGGVSRTQIRRLVERGEITRLARGTYMLPDADITENHCLAEVARQVPDGIMCLLTALRFHDLTTQNPFQVWLAIDRKAWRPKVEYPALSLTYLSGPALTEGVEEHIIQGVPVRVYSVAKTVADCFKFRNKVGLDVALEAMWDGWRHRRYTMDEIVYFGRICRVERVMCPYLEAMVA